MQTLLTNDGLTYDVSFVPNPANPKKAMLRIGCETLTSCLFENARTLLRLDHLKLYETVSYGDAKSTAELTRLDDGILRLKRGTRWAFVNLPQLADLLEKFYMSTPPPIKTTFITGDDILGRKSAVICRPKAGWTAHPLYPFLPHHLTAMSKCAILYLSEDGNWGYNDIFEASNPLNMVCE